MKYARFHAIAALALLPVSAVAGTAAMEAPASVGTVTAATSGALVIHNGKAVQATAGTKLFAGDRVITRGTSTAKVSANGCNVDLASASMYSTSGACATKGFSMQDGEAEGTGAGGGTYVVGGLALLAVIGGVVAATSGDSTPASP